jgi:hypothetical protein
MSRLPGHAGQLGTRLGDRADRAERLGEEYAPFTTTRPRTPTAAERDQIRALAAGIPGMWHAATTTDADRKQWLRALVEQVQVTVLGTREKVAAELVWTGGHRKRTRIVRRWRDRPGSATTPSRPRGPASWSRPDTARRRSPSSSTPRAPAARAQPQLHRERGLMGRRQRINCQ